MNKILPFLVMFILGLPAQAAMNRDDHMYKVLCESILHKSASDFMQQVQHMHSSDRSKEVISFSAGIALNCLGRHSESNGSTPKLANELIKLGADPNFIDYDDKTSSAGYAALFGNVQFLNFLYQSGYTFKARTHSCEPDPMDFATMKGNKEVVEYLKSKGVAKVGYSLQSWIDCDDKIAGNERYAQRLKTAAQLNDFKLVKAILALGQDVSNPGKHFIAKAAANANLEMVKLAVASGAAIDDQYKALKFAASHGNLEIINYLIAQGVPVGKKGDVVDGSVVGFIARSESISEEDSIALTWFFLKRGADPNGNDSRWVAYTPLFGAITANKPNLVRFLLANGADPNLKNDMQKTPLSDAAFDGKRQEIVRILQDFGGTGDLRSYERQVRDLQSLEDAKSRSVSSGSTTKSFDFLGTLDPSSKPQSGVLATDCLCYQSGGATQSLQLANDGKSPDSKSYHNVTTYSSGKMIPCACR